MRFNKMKSINISAAKVFKKGIMLILPLSWVIGVFFYLQPNLKPWLFQISTLKCPLFNWLSLKCPLCGLGHSLIHAWTLDLPSSLTAHPLGLLTYALSWIWFFTTLLRPTKADLYLKRVTSLVGTVPTRYWAIGLIGITLTRNLL